MKRKEESTPIIDESYLNNNSKIILILFLLIFLFITENLCSEKKQYNKSLKAFKKNYLIKFNDKNSEILDSLFRIKEF
jgi:hypothetical protein